MNLLELISKQSKLVDMKSLENLERQSSMLWNKGNAQKYRDILDKLPEKMPKSNLDIDSGVVCVTGDYTHRDLVIETAKNLIPWRKGPFRLFDTLIDSEWRSDFKWSRIKDSIGNLEGQAILDIGCNNGYFLFRMLEHNPKFVLGIDPVPLFAAQFELIHHLTQNHNLFFRLWGVDDLPLLSEAFNTIFSMGILYHHRNPIKQLQEIKQSLRPGGQVILETVGLPGDKDYSLTPKERYANMPNVWFVPTLSCLINWMERVKFVDIEVISEDWDETQEQRITQWSGKKSYENFLDSKDQSKTIEGYPAPKRFCLKARKK